MMNVWSRKIKILASLLYINTLNSYSLSNAMVIQTRKWTRAVINDTTQWLCRIQNNDHTRYNSMVLHDTKQWLYTIQRNDYVRYNAICYTRYKQNGYIRLYKHSKALVIREPIALLMYKWIEVIRRMSTNRMTGWYFHSFPYAELNFSTTPEHHWNGKWKKKDLIVWEIVSLSLII